MTPLGCMPLLHVDLFGRRCVAPGGVDDVDES